MAKVRLTYISVEIKATNSIEINRPTEEVFRFLADGLNNPKWRSAVIDISLVSGSTATLGALYRQTLKGPFGTKMQDYRITEAKPYSRIQFQVITGPVRPLGSFEISPADGRSRVRFSLVCQPTGIMRLMTGMIEKTVAAEIKNLTTLKRVMESA